jgi:hypothetical protein
VLPQVLAGLGALSLLSASCLFWLERLQPLFLAIAVGSLIYQAWAVRRRPPFLRTWGVKTIFGLSLVLNVAVIGTWVALYFRYQ